MQIIQNKEQLNKSQMIKMQAFEIILSIVASVICFICFYTVFSNIPGNKALIYGLSALIPIGLYFLKFGKLGKYVNIYLPLIIAAFIAFAYKILWSGLLLIYNGIISKFNDFGDFGILPYYTGTISNKSLYVTIALVPIIIIITYIIVLSVKNRSFIPIFLVSLPFIFTVIYFKEHSLIPAMVLMIIIWALLLSNSVGDKTFSVRKTAWVFLVIAVLTAAVYFVLPYSQYVPSKTAENAKENINDTVNDIRYSTKGEKDVLPNGNLQNLKSQNFTDTEVMTVQMQKPASIYLKSFVGSVYKNNQWTNINVSSYGGDYTGLFEWLQKNNYYPQSVISTIQGISSNPKTYKVTIDNESLTSRYIYTSYEAVANDLISQNVKYVKDYGIYSKGFLGTREYSFDMCLPLADDYSTADLSTWISSNIKDKTDYAKYLKNEKAYRAFVYENYLDVPIDTTKALNNFFTKNTMDSMKNKNYQSIVEFLRKYYLEKLKYSSEIGSLPKGKDFIENFLKTGNGYDVHFATLSVMILRSSGIPARYVEGYYLPHDYADQYKDTPNAKLQVTDSFAHEWVEIYVDGIGWIPIELTPGYYNVGKDSNTNTGKDEDVSQNDKNFYTDQENIESNDSTKNEKNNEKQTIKPTYIIITVIVLIILSYIITIMIIRKKRKDGFVQTNKNKAAQNIYKYASRLIKFDKIKIDQCNAFESQQSISQKYDDLTNMSYNEFLTYAYKSRYSNSCLTEDELDFMQKYIKSLANQIYEKQGIMKKIILIISGLI